jgi:hypothetical protein
LALAFLHTGDIPFPQFSLREVENSASTKKPGSFDAWIAESDPIEIVVVRHARDRERPKKVAKRQDHAGNGNVSH